MDASLQTILTRVIAHLQPLEVWLFGSRARGDARPTSDYDLLVVMPNDTPPELLDPIRARRTALYGLHIPADIIPCTRDEFDEEKHEVNSIARAAWLEGFKIYEQINTHQGAPRAC